VCTDAVVQQVYFAWHTVYTDAVVQPVYCAWHTVCTDAVVQQIYWSQGLVIAVAVRNSKYEIYILQLFIKFTFNLPQ